MYRDGERYKYDAKEVIRTKTVFNIPNKLKEPTVIFACSLTDFFHESIDEYRDEAWEIIKDNSQHIFQILTKRPERIFRNLPKDWFEDQEKYSHVWFGTSVGSGAYKALSRIEDLIDVKRIGNVDNKLFLSLEPLHGPVDLKGWDIPFMEPPLLYIDWIIIGGESGNETGKYRYRPCDMLWVEDIIRNARLNKVPVFVKQMGTFLAKYLKMTDRHGGNIDEFPSHLQIREFPPGVKVINGVPVPDKKII